MYRYSLLNESEVDREKVLVADHLAKSFAWSSAFLNLHFGSSASIRTAPSSGANPNCRLCQAKAHDNLHYRRPDTYRDCGAPSRMSGNTVGNSPKPISSWRISSWPSSVLDERERELWTMRAAGESFHEITLRLAEIGAREALSQRNYQCVGVGSSAPSDRSKRHRNTDRRMYCALPRSILRTKKGGK